MLKKIVYAGSQSASFVRATHDLKVLAEVAVTAKRVERWTKRVGQQRVTEAETSAEMYQALPLPKRREPPTCQVPPVACVQMDGGRIQIRHRQASADQEDKDSKGHWRESLVGCLLSMTSEQHAEDPCPTIPKTFVDASRMYDLTREFKGFSAQGDTANEPSQDSPEDRPERPKILVRSVIATRQGVDAFGRRLVAAAYQRGFHASSRKAFVADGSATNWGVHKKHFSHYTPILDFTHAVCYVYAAAMASRCAAVGWRDYCQWAQWLWSGEVEQVITAVAIRHEQLGPPLDDDETSPAAVVAKTLTYLHNQRSRMRYDEYRQIGLPITSSHIESTIKQINRRVKGSEKFWDEGAEPLLQLTADHISETNALERFWHRRPAQLPTMRYYQTTN